MPQWPRVSPSSRLASAAKLLRLVMPYTTSVVTFPLSFRCRSSRNTCSTPGHFVRYAFSHRVVVSVRRSTRPCPLLVWVATCVWSSHCRWSEGGKFAGLGGGKRVREVASQFGLVLLGVEDVIAAPLLHLRAHVGVGEDGVGGDHRPAQRRQHVQQA